MAEQVALQEKAEGSSQSKDTKKKPQGADPGEYFYNQRNLHIVFFVSCLLMFLGYLLIIYFDYKREWKVYQEKFYDMEIAKVTYEKERVDAVLRNEENKKKLDELNNALKQANANLDKPVVIRYDGIDKNVVYSELKKERESIEADLYNKQQLYNFAKGDYQSIKYEYEEASHLYEEAEKQQDRRLPSFEATYLNKKKAFEEVVGIVNKKKAEFDEVDKKAKTLDEQMDMVLSKQKELKAMVAKITEDRDAIQLRIDKEGRNFANIVRNAPIIEMFSPSIKVQQVMLPNLLDEFHFTKVAKVDRCQTCHMGISNLSYEVDEKIGEFKDSFISKYFKEKFSNKDDRKKYTMLFKAHPRLDLYVSSSSKHPIDRFGCTVCHEGDGRSTEFGWAVHTPDSEEQEKEWKRRNKDYEHRHLWDAPMLPRKHIYSSCRKCHSGEVEIATADDYNKGILLFERAGCYACHKTEGYAIFQGAEEDKRKLSDNEQKNYYRRPGPNLKFIKDKVSEEWAFKWMKDPKGFRPTTRMPKFFEQTNSRGKDIEDVIASSMVKYIFNLSGSRSYPDISLGGDVKKGEELVQALGCRACHIVGAGEDRIYDPAKGDSAYLSEFGPNLNNVGSKLNKKWLYNWLKEPEHYWKDTRMPSLRLTDDEALNISEYLLTLKSNTFDKKPGVPSLNENVLNNLVLEQLQLRMPVVDAEGKLEVMNTTDKELYLGEKMVVNYYGCYSCHELKGFEKLPGIGVELSGSQAIGSKAVNKFDFGNMSIHKGGHIPETRYNWLFNKLNNPRIYDTGKLESTLPTDLLRMPNFGFTDSEARHLVTFLMSMTTHELSKENLKELSPDEGALNRGRRIIRDSNCKACHRFSLNTFVVDADEVVLNKDKGTVSVNSKQVAFEAKLKLEDDENYYIDWAIGHSTLKLPVIWDDATNRYKVVFYDENTKRYYKDFSVSKDEKTGKVINVTPIYLSKDDLETAIQYPIPKKQVRKVLPPDGGEIFNHILRYKAVKFGKDPNNPADLLGFEAKLPPLLRTEGRKVQTQWLFNFLKNPSDIRPNLSNNTDINIRMPTFGFTDEEAVSLTRYFSAVDREGYPYTYIEERGDRYFLGRKPQIEIAKKFVEDNCVKCHYYAGKEPPGGEDRNNWGPDLDKSEQRLSPLWLDAWFTNPALIYPGTTMPRPELPGSTEEEQRNFRKAMTDYLMNFHRYDHTQPIQQSTQQQGK